MYWSKKAAISLKNVKIEEKLLWRAYRNSPMLFRTVPYRTPTAFSSERWGFGTHTQNSKLKSSSIISMEGLLFGL